VQPRELFQRLGIFLGIFSTGMKEMNGDEKRIKAGIS
jgi:hypothetical protein